MSLEPLFVDQLAVRAAQVYLSFFADYCWRDDPHHIVDPTDEEYREYVLGIIESHCAEKKIDFREYMDRLQTQTKFKPDRLRFFRNEMYGILGTDSRPSRVHFEAPRNHAKTTSISVKYPLWRLGRNPNLRVLVISKTATLAEAIVAEIRRNIDGNERLRKVFPNLHPDRPWTDYEFLVKRTLIDKTNTLRGIGIYGSITGFHPDIVILDDPFDEKETRTELQREKIVTFIEKVVYPVLNPGGEVVAVGTRWHYDDYWGKLISKSIEAGGTYLVKIYQALNYVDPEDTGSPQYVLWPQRWGFKELETAKTDLGSTYFQCLYQNDPRGLEGLFFKEKWITWYDPAILNTIPDLYLFQGVDPAISESPEAKQTAIMSVILDPRDMGIYIIDSYAERMDFPTQIKKINEYAARTDWPGFFPGTRKMRASKIGIESNAYQKALSRTTQMQALPVIEIKTTIGKPDRMLSLQPHFENGRIKWPDPTRLGYEPRWLEELRMEYLSFPRGKYTDRLDSLDFAVEVADKSGLGEITAFFG